MRLFATALIFLALPAFALDPAMFNLVSPEATALAGADIVRIQASPQGQYLMAELTKRTKDWDKVASAAGFDPRRDLREILVATSGQGAQQQPLMIARGVFDQQRLLNMATTSGFASRVYKGITIVSPPQNSGADAVAFLAGYLVAGSRAEVEAAVDRSNARTASSALGSRALLASTKYDAWVVTSMAGDLAQAIPGGGAQGIPLRGINSVLGGVQFGSQMEIGVEAEAQSAQDATSLADVIRLGAAIAQTNQSAAQIGSILASLTVSAEGNTVRAGLKVSQADFEKLFNQLPPARTNGRRVASR